MKKFHNQGTVQQSESTILLSAWASRFGVKVFGEKSNFLQISKNAGSENHSPH